MQAAVATALLLAASQAPNHLLPLHPRQSSELGGVVDDDVRRLSESMRGEVIKVRDQMLIHHGHNVKLAMKSLTHAVMPHGLSQHMCNTNCNAHPAMLIT